MYRAIERSMDNDDISPFHYKLLHFVLEKISNGVIQLIMSIIVLFKMYESFWVYSIFNHSAISNSYDQSKLVAYIVLYMMELFLNQNYIKTHMPFEYLTKRYTY